ncbi:MAG: hypothetical protein DRJ47_10995 [Thermoprotei archaeon]|nr:MAG: hypothetical protein DRJ47_10995 [Thermoprotei archaeon]
MRGLLMEIEIKNSSGRKVKVDVVVYMKYIRENVDVRADNNVVLFTEVPTTKKEVTKVYIEIKDVA